MFVTLVRGNSGGDPRVGPSPGRGHKLSPCARRRWWSGGDPDCDSIANRTTSHQTGSHARWTVAACYLCIGAVGAEMPARVIMWREGCVVCGCRFRPMSAQSGEFPMLAREVKSSIVRNRWARHPPLFLIKLLPRRRCYRPVVGLRVVRVAALHLLRPLYRPVGL